MTLADKYRNELEKGDIDIDSMATYKLKVGEATMWVFSDNSALTRRDKNLIGIIRRNAILNFNRLTK